MGIEVVPNKIAYIAIKELHEEKGYPIHKLCKALKVSKSAYYKWLQRETPKNEALNQEIAEKIIDIHEMDDTMGYRRIKDYLDCRLNIKVSDNRILRLCRILSIKSCIKYRPNGCTINDPDPKHIAENILNRDFTATEKNQKWLTDVTEFKYYINGAKHKLYLSAILDLYGRRIVAYVISDRNDLKLVTDTLELALKREPGAHPILHSDRGFQYTSNKFNEMLKEYGITHSMSRVGHCIDNGPMEGFWGILKRGRYYRSKFESRKSLVRTINSYIFYYNNKRIQRGLGLQTPEEFAVAA